MHRTTGKNRRSARALARAIARDQLTVHYQPQVDLHSGLVVGLEALVRWPHPRLGHLTAGQFLPLAEQHGLMRDIDTWVMFAVADQLGSWIDDVLVAPGFRVAINVSAHDLASPDNRIRHLIDAAGLDPGCLTLEITESHSTPDLPTTRSNMTELAQRGVRFAMDDFGAAYSTFDRLRALPFDELKLDRKVVQAADHPVGRAFVVAALDIARSLGLRVTAEGIETAEQAVFASSTGAHIGQGFLWSPALSPHEATRLLETGHSTRATYGSGDILIA